MQYGKKICALLLALCMLVGFIPAGALAAEASTQIVGQQLNLGDDLTMHFYVSVGTQHIDDAVMNIKVGSDSVGEEHTVKNMTANEDGNYVFSVSLGAPEMTADITLTLTSGGETVLQEVYSVQDYAHYLLENNYTDETKALVKEMLNYGAKAQLYFGYKTDDLANAGYELESQATIDEDAPAVTVSGSVSDVVYYGTSMVFQSKIAIRYYFNAPNGIDGCTFTVDGNAIAPVSKDGRYYIEVPGINPDEMDTEMTVKVSKGGEELSFTYSPMYYITRMYNKETTSAGLKALLLAAKGYFDAAKVFTGVAENRTGSLSLEYSYGTNNLIQVKTSLPSDTPLASFTTGQNGCSIDESANLYQNVGWIGMDLANDAIYLAFHFNSAFEAGQTYVLPVGAVFGFTDNSKYTLDGDYTFTFDGSDWSMDAVQPEPETTEPEATEPEANSLSFQYRYGTSTLIQVNTNLPSDTPCANFTADQNGCGIDQSANQYQQVGWIGMENVDGTIVLTFHFNSAFEAGQTYVLPVGAVFGFTDGSSYTLDADYTFTFDGSDWSMDAVQPEPETTEPEATEPEANSLSFQYRYGTSTLIQVNTNLPASTPCVSFTADQNGCNINQTGNTVQWFGWAGMENVDGTIVITFHFNSAFTAGQTYVLPAGAVFGFTDGSSYTLDADYTFTFDGSAWSMTAVAPVEPEPTEPPTTEPEATEPVTTCPIADGLSFQYRYGANNLIQVNTNLPSDTPCANFLTSDNGCSIDESANQYQQTAWIGMENVDGTIVLTFHFNSAFEAGQTYVLPAGAVFGFTNGNTYELVADYTFTFDGSAWSVTAQIPAEPEVGTINLTHRYSTANLIQFNSDLPSGTPCVNFTSSENGCDLKQDANQYQQVAWIGMDNVDGVIVLTFHFNADFAAGQSYILPAGSVFGFTDGSQYVLENELIFYYTESGWTTEEPAKQVNLTYRYGTANLIQYNTDLPSDTPCANFLASDNGSSLIETANQYQNVAWIGMENVDGTIVLTFHFNSDFTYGQSYILSAGSVFGFTDGSSCELPADVQLYWDGAAWGEEEPVDVLDESNFTGGKDIITFADLPVDSNSAEKIQEYKGLGFNTSLLAEDHTGAQGPDERYSVSMQTANEPVDSLSLQYRYGTSTLIQVNTNLPSSTPCVNFTADQNGCIIDQSGNTVQWVGWIGMDNVDGTIVLTFHFNKAFEAGQTYVLPKDAIFCFTDGSMYMLDADYTFTWDGSNWSMNASTLTLSLNAGSAKYIQLKTNIPTGLTYGDFLLGDTSKGHNVILETTEGAQAVAWFSYSELSGAVYLTFNFSGYNKPGTQYILKAGTSLKAGDQVFTTDRDYILTVHNDYLTSLENLDNAGLNVWIRNYHNKEDYFTENLTSTLLLYKDVIDGFYMADEAFQTNALLTAAGQESQTSDFESMSVVRDWFNTNFADKYYHSNQVPISSYDHYTDKNGNTLSAINVDGYRNFLQVYKSNYNDLLTNASGTSISFDNYPFIHAQGTYKYGILNLQSKFESGIQSTYLLNSLIAAQVAGEDDFGLCIQTYEATDLIYDVKRDITSAAEVSLQLYTGMAMGADLFEYFAYNSNGDFNAIMNTDGSKRLYDLVKEGNEALCFSDVINTFTWNGIMTSAGTVNSHNTEGFDYVADMVLADDANGVLSSISSTDDAIIGCFTKDELNGYMLVNFNDPAAVTGNNTVTVSFANCTRARVYTNVDGVLTSQLVDLTDGSYTATLVPGAACFVIPA